MLAVGVILFSSTQFMPQLLQRTSATPPTLAGLALMPGGFARFAMMIAAGSSSGFVQPRYMMAAAMLRDRARHVPFHLAVAGRRASAGSPGRARFRWLAFPFLFLTITSYSYVGLPPDNSGQASALINVARNLGGSIGVSMAQTLLARREQFHQARLAEHVLPSSPVYQRDAAAGAGVFHRARRTAPQAHSTGRRLGRPDDWRSSPPICPISTSSPRSARWRWS